MTVPLQNRPRRQVRVVLSSTALLSFMSVRKAAALAIAQLGVGAFFVVGPLRSALGDSAAWFVLAAAIVGAFVRAIDIESWALLLPGGAVARVHHAFGPRAARAAAAAGLAERLLLAALACIVVGQYAATVTLTAIAGWRLTGFLRPEDFATVVAVLLAGMLWLRSRIGLDFTSNRIARGVWIAVGILTLLTAWGLVSVSRAPVTWTALATPPAPVTVTGWWVFDAALVYLFGFALALPTIGGGDAVARAAHELRPPRLQALQRTSLFVSLFTGLATVSGAFLFVLLVPAVRRRDLDKRATRRPGAAPGGTSVGQETWSPSRSSGQPRFCSSRRRTSRSATPSSSCSVCRSKARCRSASPSCTRSSARRHEPSTSRWPRPSSSCSSAADASAGWRTPMRSPSWRRSGSRSRRSSGCGTSARRLGPSRRPSTCTSARARSPSGSSPRHSSSAPARLAMVVARDPPAIATFALMGGLVLLFTGVGREALPPSVAEEPDAFDILPADELSLDQMDVRPGGVLVLVRNPHSLAHVAAALQTPRDRDVVVMTVRLAGRRRQRRRPERCRADGGRAARCSPRSSALAERHDRPVRLLIVPAHNVFDADRRARSCACARRTCYVGESSTLSADDQARLLGEAWERADDAPSRSTSGSSSITAAAAPTPSTSARTRRRSPRAISISSIACGSTPSRPSVRTSIITTSSGRH